MKINQWKDTTSLVLSDVMCSYPAVTAPKLNNLSGNMEYSVDLLIPKADKVDMAGFNKVISIVKEDKWGSGVPTFRYDFLKDGDMNIDKEGEIRGGYVGVQYITAKSQEKDPPVVVDLMNKDLTGGAIAGGDILNVFVRAYAYDRAGNKGIGFQVVRVQLKRKADEPLGGGVSQGAAVDAFKEYATDDDMMI
jgi:hypothetical protein